MQYLWTYRNHWLVRLLLLGSESVPDVPAEIRSNAELPRVHHACSLTQKGSNLWANTHTHSDKCVWSINPKNILIQFLRFLWFLWFIWKLRVDENKEGRRKLEYAQHKYLLPMNSESGKWTVRGNKSDASDPILWDMTWLALFISFKLLLLVHFNKK